MPVCKKCMMVNNAETRYCFNCGWWIHPYSGFGKDHAWIDKTIV